MRVWTYGEALDVVKAEFDLTNETFIGDDEFVTFFNKAIQIASADIFKLGVEDEYFQDEANLSLTSGQASVAMPSNIYANKIRSIIYHNGTEIYEVLRMRRRKKFINETIVNQYATDARYRYRIKNAGTTLGPRIILNPPSRLTSATVMTAYYIREAEYIPLVSAGSLVLSRAAKIDLPECSNFIFAYTKWCIANKIPHPNLMEYKTERDEERRLMIDTLTGQTDDDQTEVEPDMSHYQESS